MRLYSLYTRSHAVLKNEWFLKTLCDDFELVLTELPHEAQPYGTTGFNKLTWLKLDIIIEAVHENWGRPFLYSDVDVQFFAPIEKLLLELIGENDMLIQRDSPQGTVCSGFTFCQANERTLDFFKSIRATCASVDGKYDDQEAANIELFKYALLEDRRQQRGHEIVNEAWYRNDQNLQTLSLLPNDFGLNWDYLPESFCSAGTITGEFWEPGKHLMIPNHPLVHHANWTVGVSHKLAQLEHVRRQVAKAQTQAEPRTQAEAPYLALLPSAIDSQ